MSYAGTYGDDETCMHNTYWRSCKDCSLVGPKATQEQIDAAKDARIKEVETLLAERERKAAERHTSTVVRDGFGKIISEEKHDP